jgi:hypothetical protein
MPINPSAPIYPEADTNLLQNGVEPILTVPAAPYSSPDYQVPNDQVQPEVDIALLPGVPGQRGPRGFKGDTGPTGPAGVDNAVAPILLDSVTHTISLNQSGLQINAAQVVGILGVTTYTYTQNAVSSNWSITHNLGFYPNVVSQDSAGTIIEGSVNYVSVNQLIITFSIPLTGKAFLS